MDRNTSAVEGGAATGEEPPRAGRDQGQQFGEPGPALHRVTEKPQAQRGEAAATDGRVHAVEQDGLVEREPNRGPHCRKGGPRSAQNSRYGGSCRRAGGAMARTGDAAFVGAARRTAGRLS